MQGVPGHMQHHQWQDTPHSGSGTPDPTPESRSDIRSAP